MAHGITNDQYRHQFGYSNSTVLTSLRSSEKSSSKIRKHYYNGDYNKFIESSKATRFIPGVGSRIYRKKIEA